MAENAGKKQCGASVKVACGRVSPLVSGAQTVSAFAEWQGLRKLAIGFGTMDPQKGFRARLGPRKVSAPRVNKEE
jgi:hypothetical protein